MILLITLSYIVGLGLLMMFSSFFSGSETALTALSKMQIQRLRVDKHRSSRAILRFIDDPRRLFITVLFGNTLVNMAFVSITGSLIYEALFKGKNAGLAFLVAIFLQTLLLLVLGEVTPKTFAIEYPEKFARTAAGFLWTFSIIIFPFRKTLRYITNILLPLFGVHSFDDKIPITTEEIKAIVRSSALQGALDEEEGEILHNIFELHDIPAREVMVPRTAMVCVEVSNTIQEVFQVAKKAGHSRFPIFRGRVDNVCGIFYVKDLPRWKGLKVESLSGKLVEQLTIDEFLTNSQILFELNPKSKNTLIRPPFFTINSKKIGPLMRELARERQQMAILLDEYGSISGLITVEDIVEEVLGEIFDEYDTVSELTIKRDPDDPSGTLIPGFVSLRSANRRLKLNLDTSRADTIGGYVVNLFGAIPGAGAVVVDRQNNLEFKVLQTEGTRISLVRLRFLAKKKEKISRNIWSLFIVLPALAILSGASSVNQSSSTLGFHIFLFSAILILALVLLAFYAGAETAVVSASKARIDVLASQKNPRALIIKKLWQEPDKMLGLVLVGTNLMSATAGVAGLRLVHFLLHGKEGLQEFVNTVAMTLLILVFCEILPKTTFRAKANTMALRSAPGLRISGFLLNPIVFLVTKISNSIVRIAPLEESGEKLRRMREELKLLSQMGVKDGALKREQLQMISSVLDLETLTLEKVLTPLVDIVAIPRETSLKDYFKVVAETGFSRIPVYKDRVDNIIGLVNILDVLYSDTSSSSIAPFIKSEVRHEPKSKRVYSLLRELKISRNPMVFVVDEYGGIIGLVTIEDLVEEILGEIHDEKDKGYEGLIHQISDKIIECDGKTETQLIKRLYGISMPAGDYITIAGYLNFILERIPKPGEFVETETFKVVVLESDLRSVRRVRITSKS